MKLFEYARDVKTNPEVYPITIQQAVDRFERDLLASKTDDFPYYLDLSIAKRFEDFVGLIKQKDGHGQGKPFVLLPFQAFIFGQIYGWKRKTDNTYRFRNVFIELPRKAGKTTIIALVVIFEAIATGNFAFLGACTASTEKQARKLFSDIKELIKFNVSLQPFFRPLRDEIHVKGTNGRFQVFASNEGGLDGILADLIVIDELHAFLDDRVYSTLLSGLLGKQNQKLIAITTAGRNFNSFAFTQEAYAKKILTGQEVNENFLAIIYQPDPGDDLTSPDTWRKVQPGMGHSVTMDEYTSLYLEGKSSPTKWANFCVKNLNFWMRNQNNWLKREDVLARMTDKTIEDFYGSACYLSFDLSLNNDLSTYCQTFPDEETGLYYQFWKTWIPGKKLEEKTRYENGQYPAWVQAGLVQLCDGDVIDHNDIFESIVADSKRFVINEISYDEAHSALLIQKIHEALPKIPKVPVKPSKLSFSPMIAHYENEMFHDRIKFQQSELFLWNATNAILSSSDLKKLEKKFDADKIDLLTTAVMGFWRASLGEQNGTYKKQAFNLENFGF